MKYLIKMEIKKAIKNRFFLIAVLIGGAITVLSLIYNYQIYHEHQLMLRYVRGNSEVVQNPLYPMFTVFNNWIGGEPFSLGSSLYFFVFPLLVALPYGWSYCEEKTSGYHRYVVAKTGKTKYFLSKYLAVFISGGLAMVIPLIFNFITAMLIFPAITPIVVYDTAYGVFGGSLMSKLYYTIPFIYLLVYLIIDFVFCGLIACLAFVGSVFIKYKAVVVILPQMLLLLFHYVRQYVYVSGGTQYKEISPLFFLRPVQSAYRASWVIILVEMLILFVVTFGICVLGEKRNEIY
ncbi:MAG TPA: hypothetical protein IAC41_06295 [Candidatus Merdenecus merdavium]|nr:hypothetical protein [Candidatus Merdenecus merdavium]